MLLEHLLVAREDRDPVAASDPGQPFADQVVGVIVLEERAAAVDQLVVVVGWQRDDDAQAVRRQKQPPHRRSVAGCGQSTREPQARLLHEHGPDQGWPPFDNQRSERRQHPNGAAPPIPAQPPKHHGGY